MVSVRHLPGPTHGKAGVAVTTLLQFLRDLLLAVLAPRAALVAENLLLRQQVGGGGGIHLRAAGPPG